MQLTTDTSEILYKGGLCPLGGAEETSKTLDYLIGEDHNLNITDIIGHFLDLQFSLSLCPSISVYHCKAHIML